MKILAKKGNGGLQIVPVAKKGVKKLETNFYLLFFKQLF